MAEVYIILPTNISNMTYPNRQKEELAQFKYCISLSNANLEQVLVQNVSLTSVTPYSENQTSIKNSTSSPPNSESFVRKAVIAVIP